MDTNTEILPQLRHCTLIEQHANNNIHLMLGGKHFNVEPETECGKIFMRAKKYFDGRHTIEEASTKLGVQTEDLKDLTQQFSDLNFFKRKTAEDKIDVSEFIQHISLISTSWNQQIGYHKLFCQLESGSASKEVFIGLLLETYHYVKSASKHISVAIAHSSNQKWNMMLSKYLAEEYTHSSLILSTLDNLGVKAKDVQNSAPTVGTLALIHMLCEIGRHSTLGYFVAMGFSEARREDAALGSKSLQDICKIYGHDPVCVEPILSHMYDDLEAEHSNILVEALEDHAFITRSEADFIANMLHDLKHSFDLFHDQIFSYYTGPTNFIPRIKLDFSLL